MPFCENHKSAGVSSGVSNVTQNFTWKMAVKVVRRLIVVGHACDRLLDCLSELGLKITPFFHYIR